ncbi:class II aldolase/adducin family protein [Gracilibacillus salinarum]|uniref:Class II aldolase/adducin family protein n=1 Tax=Gracilibacillus salinarum TaxID=2932255 RepID=A0ABY4GHK0_9BACI|nr:class II aldolase/adducin family protein [Gracilibacillus salinarum]UOQ83673.1 class II aldolase/adducin family protein [Gracilibacillus salinarum]
MDKQLVKDLQRTGKFMMDKDLAWGTAGNISARHEDGYLISATGTYLGELEMEDFSYCVKGEHLDGKKPSKEFLMHEGIYQERPEINAVLHASPFYSTLIANSNLELPSNYFVESMYYLERITRIPFYNPGSKDLAIAVKEQAKEANVFLLENHGIIVCDVNLKEARTALQTLEYTAKMHITALEKNISMNGLSEETVYNFIHHSGYKPVRNWHK